MAAIGVIKIANDSKQATNTLALPGIDSEFDFFTVIIPKGGRPEDGLLLFLKTGAGDETKFHSVRCKTNTV